jgi:hypothetical protein
MSKGPGRLERAIAAIFTAEPEVALTTEEMCLRVYGEPVEKKHRVAIVRATRKVMARNPDICCHEGGNLGGQLVFFRGDVVMSRGLARLKADNLSEYRNNDPRYAQYRGSGFRPPEESELLAQLHEGGRYHHLVTANGAWCRHTEMHIAEQTDDVARLALLQGKQEAALTTSLARLNAAFERQPSVTFDAATFARKLRDLAMQNDPDIVRDGILAVADQLDHVG